MCRQAQSLVAIAALASLPALPSDAGAQTAPHFAEGSTLLVGYAANAPQQLLGVGMAAIFPGLGGWGLYLDAKVTADSPGRETVLPAADPLDVRLRNEDAWTSTNAAVVRGFTRDFAAYVGGGVSWRTTYHRFADQSGERGDLGRYWVEEEDQPEAMGNLIVGAFLGLGRRLAIQAGWEAAPSGFTVGAHLRVR